MLTERIAGRAPSPWFLVQPPDPQPACIDRPRIVAQLGETVAAHRLTTVFAPSGYGKTLAVAEWTRRSAGDVAWLALTRFDDDPGRILRGVVSAFHRLTEPGGGMADALGALMREDRDLASAVEALIGAIDGAGRPLTLVIDDVQHAAGTLDDSIVGALVEVGVPSLHVVLAGAGERALRLGRLDATGGVGRLSAADLAFDADEIARAAAALGRRAADVDVDRLLASTAGWPVAVRLALLDPRSLAAHPSTEPRRDHQDGFTADEAMAHDTIVGLVVDDVLGTLDPHTADFVSRTTTCSRIDARLATALSGRTDASELLERCTTSGLFLDRIGGSPGRTVYRWHQTFAHACREALGRRDPALVTELNRVAAAELAEAFPLEALVHATRAGDAELTSRIVVTRWIRLILGGHAGALERSCARLPAPWDRSPEILMIRASCRDVQGDRTGSAVLFASARTAMEDLDAARIGHTDVVAAVGALFVADGHEDLMQHVDTVRARLERGDLPPETAACVLFLIGWTEMRLRRRPGLAVRLLEAAVQACDLHGVVEVADRARANLAFACAFGGRFREVDRVVAELGAAPDRNWTVHDDGIDALAAGYVAYWRNDLAQARVQLRRVLDDGAGGRSLPAALARTYLVHVACASGDPAEQRSAERELQLVGEGTEHGVPWADYKLVAECTLAEARHDRERLAILVAQVPDVRYQPVVSVMVAELQRRLGDEAAASARIEALDLPVHGPYIRASAGLVMALIARGRGDVDEAHRVLEDALEHAVTETVIRPFADDEPALRDLLVEHATWGTEFEGFLAARIAQGEATASRRLVLGSPLSPREHEVLGFLRTSMTTTDIARALFVSVNTVKTHQRAIYRKLGVANRREAVSLKI